MWAKHKGFTIVELLIVIVVIAVLAVISVVAYSGVQLRATTATRLSEVKQWEKTFKLYRANDGSWPSSIVYDKYYCLGTGFPTGGGGVARCRDYLGTGTESYLESDNTALINQLKTVVTLPITKKEPIDVTVGPYMRVYGDGSQTIELTQLFSPQNSTCPGGMSEQFRNSTRLWCEVRITP